MTTIRLVCAAVLLLAVELAAATPEVVPGSVVRWGAPGVTACSLGDRTWAPVGDTCYFPVDLLATGHLTFERIRNAKTERLTVTVGRYPYPEQRLTVPEKMVHLSREDSARVERENARIARLWPRESVPRFALPLAPPLSSGFIGARFGHRRVFNGQPRSPHNGLYFKAPAGTAVRAPADGVVVLAENHFFAGNSVFVDHGGGLISMSFHLADLPVHVGQEVRRGEVLGHVGSTGRATGPHLHFGVRWHGARIDPNLLFEAPERLPSLEP